MDSGRMNQTKTRCVTSRAYYFKYVPSSPHGIMGNDDQPKSLESRNSLCDSEDTLASLNPCTETTPLLGSIQQTADTLPKLQIFTLLFIFLPESVTSTLIYPFIVQLVRDLNIVKGDPAAVGYYSGLIESCFFITEAIAVFFWARTSDKIGRKPVLLFGSLSLAIALLSFGFSTTLWGVMASRALQGALNGNIGVARAMLSEVTNESNRAWAFSFTPVVWATGATLGPVIGGSLAKPADRFSLFSNPFWETHPYLLPTLAAASFSLAAFFLALFCIHETRRNLLRHYLTSVLNRGEPSSRAMASSRTDEVNSTPPSSETIQLSLLINRHLLSILFNHALLALLDQSYIALLAVFLATPITSGGLGFTPSQIGLLLGATGLFHGVLQPFCFASLYHSMDPKRLYTICMFMTVPAYACFPIINDLAKIKGLESPILWVAVVTQIVLLLPTYTAFSAMFIFISCAAPTKDLTGTTNGIAQTVFSSMGAIGPAGVTSLFAISHEKQLLGGRLVYLIMCAIGCLSGLAAHYLLPKKPGEEVGQDHLTDD